jgi:endonuclease/exonuclease/phosphatase family metal-dependent hydrolase
MDNKGATLTMEVLTKTAAEAAIDSKTHGYRSVMQAVNQAANYNNVILSRLRVDVIRQIEAEMQLALYTQKERTVIHAAFGQAVKKWSGGSAGTGY